MKARVDRIGYLEYLHDLYNKSEFSGKLGTPKFGLTRSRNTDGYYEHFSGNRQRRLKSKICVSSYCFDSDEEGHVEGTMLHEMIHQYQHEVLERKTNHDAIFTSIARRLERKYGFRVR